MPIPTDSSSPFSAVPAKDISPLRAILNQKPLSPLGAPSLGEAESEVAATEQRFAGIQPWEVYADSHRFGQLETETLEILTGHRSASELDIAISKLKRLALLRYGAALLVLMFLPGCVSIDVGYDAATGQVTGTAHYLPKQIQPTK